MRSNGVVSSLSRLVVMAGLAVGVSATIGCAEDREVVVYQPHPRVVYAYGYSEVPYEGGLYFEGGYYAGIYYHPGYYREHAPFWHGTRMPPPYRRPPMRSPPVRGPRH